VILTISIFPLLAELPTLVQVGREFLFRGIVAPYKRLINKLISPFEEEMYERKEKLVERLQELTKLCSNGI
jgi:hypothetical protein